MAPLIPLRGHQPGESQGPTDGLRLKPARFQNFQEDNPLGKRGRWSDVRCLALAASSTFSEKQLQYESTLQHQQWSYNIYSDASRFTKNSWGWNPTVLGLEPLSPSMSTHPSWSSGTSPGWQWDVVMRWDVNPSAFLIQRSLAKFKPKFRFRYSFWYFFQGPKTFYGFMTLYSTDWYRTPILGSPKKSSPVLHWPCWGRSSADGSWTAAGSFSAVAYVTPSRNQWRFEWENWKII